MSCIKMVKVDIVNPNIGILEQTMKEIASITGGELVRHVVDYYGNREEVLMGIRNSVFHRGIGVKISANGQVQVVGDFWGIPRSEVKRFRQMLVQRYTANALAYALGTMGYSVAKQEAEEQILIRAIQY